MVVTIQHGQQRSVALSTVAMSVLSNTAEWRSQCGLNREMSNQKPVDGTAKAWTSDALFSLRHL